MGKGPSFKATITHLHRLNDSPDGWKRWRVSFDNGAVHVTSPRSSIGERINHPREEYNFPRVGREVEVWLDRDGIFDLIAPPAAKPVYPEAEMRP